MYSISILTLLLLLLLTSGLQLASAITFPLPDDCPTSCGNISVPYPFGLKDGCFRPGFDLFCNTSIQPPMLFLGNGITQVTKGYGYGYVYVYGSVYGYVHGYQRYISINAPSQVFRIDEDGMMTEEVSWAAGAAYAMSSENRVTLVGCHLKASLIDGATNQTMGACTTTCVSDKEMMYGLCDGIGCCQIAFLWNVKSYRIQITVSNETTLNQSTATKSTVVKVLVAEESAYNFQPQDLHGTGNLVAGLNSAMLEVNIPDAPNCEIAQKNKSTYACMGDSFCTNSTTLGLGYACYCHYPYFDGSPYTPQGCLRGRVTWA